MLSTSNAIKRVLSARFMARVSPTQPKQPVFCTPQKKVFIIKYIIFACNFKQTTYFIRIERK